MKVLVDVELHEPSPYARPTYTYADEASHLVSNRCIKCAHDYPDTPEHQAHFPSDAPGLPPWESNGEWSHTCSNICDGCGRMFPGSELCDAYVDVSFGDGDSDFEVCRRCGNSRSIEHHFVPDGDETHHCSNGGGHFYEQHIWGDVNTNICIKCGWDREEHRRPDPEVWTTNYCANCSYELTGDRCYAVFKNGIYQEAHCAAGWNVSANKCGCFACTHSLTYGCTCKWDNLMRGSNGDHFPAEWTFDGSN